jgi:hypothetical protein
MSDGGFWPAERGGFFGEGIAVRSGYGSAASEMKACQSPVPSGRGLRQCDGPRRLRFRQENPTMQDGSLEHKTKGAAEQRRCDDAEIGCQVERRYAPKAIATATNALALIRLLLV